MKWLDSDIELVACGSSSHEMPTFGAWERTVLRHTYDYVDYLSLHTYYKNIDNDLSSFLANNIHMDRYIKEVAGICEEIKAEKQSEKDIYLSFDEWNVWYHFQKDCEQPSKWIKPRPIEEETYDFADALLIGSLLITLINNSDVVKISCLAQLVNTIAPIMTQPGGGSWIQTIYYPFLYTSQYGRGTALNAHVETPLYSCSVAEDVPFIDCAAVLSKHEDELVLFIVNKNLSEDIFCVTDVSGLRCKKIVEWVSLFGYTAGDVNTIDHSPVYPCQINSAELESNRISFMLPKASWNMLRVKIAIEKNIVCKKDN
jgi:alpha-N-arabinofuranosidase